MMNEGKTVFVAIYSEVDYYPPTLNALHLLAQKFQQVIVLEVVTGEHIGGMYPSNVQVHSVPRKLDSRRARFSTFIAFQRLFNDLRKRRHPDLILLYDPIAAMAGWISLKSSSKKEIWWYHNHDIIEKSTLQRYSLLYFASILEKKFLAQLDIFSLPAAERITQFDCRKMNGVQQVIPNYPSFLIYTDIHQPQKSTSEIILIYQGNISDGHGLEEILNLLPRQINNKAVRLVLTGFSNAAYNAKLHHMINDRNLKDVVTILEKRAYHKLPFITGQCHLGIAIYTKSDIMNSTLGTASNKIYEYTACGLPFLYYDTLHFKHYLSEMEWAIPTDLSEASLLNSIQRADDNFEQLSRLAKHEFIARRNYEKVFMPVLNTAISLIESNTITK